MPKTHVTEGKSKALKISDDKVHRVCAYCRVSTDEYDQRNSLMVQKEFFESYFEEHPNWVNVGIFADEGLSGTSLKKRDEFNRMISIAKHGGIDIILTKEVSRFSRNVQDLLNVVKDLRDRGVYVWFLSDDIYTEDIKYIEPLTIAGNSAQSESLRTSRRVKWGHQRKMEQGVVFGRKEMFGYNIIRNGKGKQEFEVIQEEAEIVKMIFEWFAAGDGTHTIARRLEQMKIETKRYSKGWSNTVILRLLRNEKYVGDLAQGKTYTPDAMTHAKKYNRGEANSYYTPDHHTPIIDRELWDKVQDILKAKEPSDEIKAKHSNRYWCSGKVFCGLCGSRYISLTKKQKTIPYKAWDCIENNRRGKYKEITLDTGDRKMVGCNGLRVNDRVLKLAVHDLVEQYILPQKDALIGELQEEIKKLDKPTDNSKKIAVIESKIENAEESLDELALQLADKVITAERYKRVSKKREEEIADLKQQLVQLKVGDNSSTLAIARLTRCIEEMHKIVELSDDEFNEGLFERITSKIVVYPLNIIAVYLTAMKEPVIMQYETRGRGEAYTAVFTILSEEQFEELRKDMTKNELPMTEVRI